MKIDVTLQRTNEISATLTITMSIGSWKEILDALTQARANMDYAYKPVDRLDEAIDKLIRHVEGQKTLIDTSGGELYGTLSPIVEKG